MTIYDEDNDNDDYDNEDRRISKQNRKYIIKRVFCLKMVSGGKKTK